MSPGFPDARGLIANRTAGKDLLARATRPAAAVGLTGRSRDKIGLPPTREHYRHAQRYSVQVYDWEWRQLLFSERIASLHDGAIHVLIHPENDYDEDFGLRPPTASDSPSAFMV